MRWVSYKNKPYTEWKSGQIRSPNESVAWVSCGACVMGHLGCRIWWWHSFSDLTHGTAKVRSNWVKFRNSFSHFLSYLILSKDKRRHLCLQTTIRNVKNMCQNMTSLVLPVFGVGWGYGIAKDKDIASKSCTQAASIYIFWRFSFAFTSKLCILEAFGHMPFSINNGVTWLH